jgi:hypothetical protein
MESSMTILSPKTGKLVTLGLTALVASGAALISSAPARAGDYGYDEEAGFRPRVERRVIIEERRVVERRIVNSGYGAGFPGPLGYNRPVHFGYPGYARPAFYGHPGYARPAFGGGECRVIVKKRVDPWGDVTVKRIRICD